MGPYRTPSYCKPVYTADCSQYCALCSCVLAKFCPVSTNVDGVCRTAVLEYLVAHVQAGRMLMAQQDDSSQQDTHMAPASPAHLNVSLSINTLFLA